MFEEHVPKVWGSEFWYVNTEFYCAKRLVVTPMRVCSVHRHLIKDETFICLEGEGWIEREGELYRIMPGESLRIYPGQWHRFWSEKGMTLLEVSTRHDENDVERMTASGEVARAIPVPTPPVNRLR